MLEPNSLNTLTETAVADGGSPSPANPSAPAPQDSLAVPSAPTGSAEATPPPAAQHAETGGTPDTLTATEVQTPPEPDTPDTATGLSVPRFPEPEVADTPPSSPGTLPRQEEDDAGTRGLLQGAPARKPTQDEIARTALELPQSIPSSQLSEADPFDKKAAFWDKVLTGDLDTVPDYIRRQARVDDITTDTEEQAYRLAQTINRSWLAENTGRSREDVRERWSIYRGKLASDLNVANDEMEVFHALSIRQRDTSRREAARKIYRDSYKAGLLGHDYEDDTATLNTLDPEDRIAVDALGVGAYQEGADLRERWLPLVERTANGIDAFAGMEEEVIFSPRTFKGMPDLVSALDELTALKPDDLNLVLYLAGEMAKEKRISGKGDESLAYRMYRAGNRGVANIAIGAVQALENMGIATLNTAGRAWGGDTGLAMQREADAWDRRARMAYTLANINQQELSPLYPADGERKAEKYLIDAAESTPGAILSFCGPYGFTALTFSSMGHSVAEARQRAPESKQETQLCAGITAGIAQAGFYMSLNRLGGKMLENSISSFFKARGAGAAAFSMGALKTAGAASLHGAELWAAGKLSQAADLGAQELASRLSDTASNIDWESYGDNITDIDANLHEAASILPFLLIASGRASLHHFRSPKALLGDGTPLKEWGIDEQTCTQIMAASNPQTKGALLREALRKSPRWADPKLKLQAVRAMQLLNVDYFKDFNQEDIVADFLQLPAETDRIRKPEAVRRTEEEVHDLPEHVYSRNPGFLKKNFRYEDSLALWDSWWQKSHIANYVGPYFKALMGESDLDNPRSNRSAAYQIILNNQDNPVPERMRNTGIYAPLGEAERRALLRDTVQETKDLAYQCVMIAYPLDSLLKNALSLARTAKDADKARRRILGQVGKTVMDIALGTPGEAAELELRQFMANYYTRRTYRGASPEWLKEMNFGNMQRLPELTAEYDNVQLGEHYEVREVLRVLGGLSACSRRLAALLPMTSDFSTALSRGMSPIQSYHHLLQRELENTAKDATRYPFAAIEQSATSGDMERFNTESRDCYERFRALTGGKLEQSPGADGTIHWRAALPDGNPTRWHASEQDAINDLAINTAPFFSPMGEGYYNWSRFFGKDKPFDINDRPTATHEEFSGFDQLAGIALRDLKDYLYNSPTRLLPGHKLKQLRHFFIGGQKSFGVQTEKDNRRTPGGDTVVDSISVATPYSLTESRMLVFWKRMLDSNFISADKVAQFLQDRGRISAEERAALDAMTVARPFPWNRNTPLKLTPAPNIGGRNRKLAERMARYHTVRFFADLENRDVPASVRHWFNMVPFCPALPTEQYASPVAPYVSRRIPIGPEGRTALSWNNRMTAMDLNSRAAEFEAMRREMQENPLPENGIAELFRLADDGSTAGRYEQGWCYYHGGAGVFDSTPQSMWNLLQFPRRAWGVMPRAERDDLVRRVQRIAKDSAVSSAVEAEARGESPDYVEHAILNLDDVLQRFPDLHLYSAIPGTDAKVSLLHLNDRRPRNKAVFSPETDAVPLYMDTTINGRGITRTEVETPGPLRSDPDAMKALRFLDVLRATTTSRPYVADNTIWWKDSPYGGSGGKRPWGLRGWEQSDPLVPLFDLLRSIDTLNQTTGEPALDICGVQVRGADWRPTDFDGLSAVTVYRSPEDIARVYRLMPGFPQSSSMDVRTPYFVANHYGLYMGEKSPISKPEQLYNSYHPLELFSVKPYTRPADKHLAKWRRTTIGHTLDALAAWPKHSQELVEDGTSGVHGLNELVLRLCEDTGFSLMLHNKNPETLTPPQAHVVNIARAALECMQAPDSPEALKGLESAMEPLMKQPKLREAVIDMLIQSNEGLIRGGNADLKALRIFTKSLDKNILQKQKEQQLEEWYGPKNGPAGTEKWYTPEERK